MDIGGLHKKAGHVQRFSANGGFEECCCSRRLEQGRVFISEKLKSRGKEN